MFLTAAHCALNSQAADEFSYRQIWSRSEEFRPGRWLKLSFARTVGRGAPHDQLQIKQVHFLPALESTLLSCPREGTRTPVPDIAVIEILHPQNSPDFLRAPCVTLSERKLATGEPISLLGFGHQNEEDKADATLKDGENAAYPMPLLAEFLEDTPVQRDGAPRPGASFGAPGYLEDPRFPSLGAGDSGGPVFHRHTGELVGINSDGYCPIYKEECEKAGNSIFARVDASAEGAPARWLREKQKNGNLFFLY